MSPLVERLTELRRHLEHLQALQPRVPHAGLLAQDLSLHNDVLFSLMTLCQLVIDIAGELSARRGVRYEDDTGAVRNLGADPRFPAELVRALERLPGFRNVIIHEYVALDLNRAFAALHDLEPIREFMRIVAEIEAGPEDGAAAGPPL
mgnify:CR=1 FL=1